MANMLTTAEVQAHISDQALAAALSAGDDIAAAARLSELLTETVPVPLNQLAAWAASTGVRARIQDAANDTNSPVRSIALTALDLLRGSMAGSYDTVVYSGLLDALEAGGAILAADRTALTALATQPRVVTANEVARAIRNDDGSSKL